MRRPSVRWWLVALAALAMGAAGTYQFAWSAVRGPLGARLGAGEAALGTVFTTFVLAQTLSQFPAGRYRDRHGPRLPLAIGGLLVAVGFGGVALAPSFPVALVAYALGGVGSGFVYTVAVNTPVKWFTERRGLATGVVTLSYSAASAPVIAFIGPNAARDFAGTLLTVAAATGLACLLGVPFLRDPADGEGNDAERDGDGETADGGSDVGDAGAAPAGDDAGATSGGDDADATSGGDDADATSGGDDADATPGGDDADGSPATEADVDPAAAYGWRETVRTWQFWVLFGVFFVVNGVGLMLVGKVVSLAVGLGLPAAVGTLAASTLAVADGAGIAVVGGLSDRLGRERTIAASMTLCGVSLAGAVLLGPGNGTAFVALVGAAAFFRSPAFSVFPSLVGDYYGAARSSENYALLYGAKVPGGVAGGTAASLLIAAVGWSAAFLFGAGLFLLAGLAAATLRPVQRTARTAESAA